MIHVRRAGIAFLALATYSFAQRSQKEPAFEVASVKAAALYPNGPSPILNERLAFQGGPGTIDPGRIRYKAPSMRMLLRRAYNLRPDQIAGPSWIDEQGYEIIANVPPGADEQQVRV